MDNYIKTIINGVKTWAGSRLTRLEVSVSKMGDSIKALSSKISGLASNVTKHTAQIAELYEYEEETYGIAANAQSTADDAKTAAANAQSTADNAQTAADNAKNEIASQKAGATWMKSDGVSGYFKTVAYADGLWVAGSGSSNGLYYSVSKYTPYSLYENLNAKVDSAVADTISEAQVNELIDTKLGVVENGSY